MKKNESISNIKIKEKPTECNNDFFNRFCAFVCGMKDWLLLTIIFVLCFVTLLSQQMFIRKFSAFDELTYYNIAKNIFMEGDFRFYGLKTFPLIIYPLLISPFFAIQNSILRLQIIYIFNSLLLASSIFPIWFISKELNISRKIKYIVIFFAVLSPIMTFSYIIMAEALYYPFILWITVLALRNSKKNKWYLSLLLGILFYLSFITKRIGAIAFLAYLITSVLVPLTNKILDKDKNKPISQYYNKKNLLNLGFTFIVFLTLYFAFRYTIFNDPLAENIGSIFNVFKTLFSSFKNFAYVVYWTILFLASFVMSLLIFPFLYPILYFKALNKKAKTMFLFSIIYLAILSFYVAASITFIEEPYELMPNIHLRYTIPIHIIIIMIFVSLLDSEDAVIFNAKTKKHFLIFVISSFVIALLFKGNRFMPVDANFLSLFTSYREFILSELASATQYIIYLIFVLTNLVIVSIIFILDRFFISKKKHIVPFALVSIFSITTLTVGTLKYRNSSSGDYAEILEIQKIDKFICNDTNSTVLCLVNDWGWSCYTIEPHINKTDKKFIMETSDYFKKSMSDGQIGTIRNEISNIKFSPLYAVKEINLDKIDYIMLPRKTTLQNFYFRDTTILPEFNGKYFQLLKNIDNKFLSIEIAENGYSL